ncbi:MAG TPA: hypothetical protein VG734_25965 [Lacunisphaera sp.]|nr:hypothetical protein [Lacunisphaera sp.]
MEELELRLSKPVHGRVFNDHDLGEVEENADFQLRIDASSKVRGALANTYDIDTLVATNAVFRNELRRITLDVAHAMCAIRNPAVIKIDGFSLMAQCERELQQLRDAKTSLVSDTGDESGGGGPADSAGATDMPDEPTVDECRPLPGLGNFYG